MSILTFPAFAAANPPPGQVADATDDDHDPDRPMNFEEESNVADQGPLTDMDMEEDAEILALLLKLAAADIEQFVRLGHSRAAASARHSHWHA